MKLLAVCLMLLLYQPDSFEYGKDQVDPLESLPGFSEEMTIEDLKKSFLSLSKDEQKAFLDSLGSPEAAMHFLLLFSEIPRGTCRGTYQGDTDKQIYQDDRVCHI